MRARRLGGLAEVAGERGVEHVLHERALARAADPGDDDEVMQRQLDRDVLQVVLARVLDDEPRRRIASTRRLKPMPACFLAAEVGAGQRVGALDRLVGRAIEHDLAAADARAGAHVDQAVGGQHHGRVVFDDDERVAGVAQATHRLDDAVQIARMQADARLVEHEERLRKRGAERRRQVDALHLAAREGAALAVERQVADADVAEILQARAHLVEQQLQRLVEQPARQREAIEEAADAVDRQHHQVVHGEAGHRLDLLARPCGADRQEALRRRHHGVGVFLRAQPPEQRLELQARAAARRARRVAPVLRQEHADVHLVGLRLEVGEEALDPVPLLVPLAVPARRAVDHPGALGIGELRPGGVARNAGLAGVLHQVVLALLPRRRLDGLDRPRAQRLAVIGDDEAQVDTDHAAKAAAGLARAVRRELNENRAGCGSA